MSENRHPEPAALKRRGLLRANRWLIARRAAQLSFFLLFAAGPWFGVWIAKGTLASSLTLGILPLTDPLIVLQSFAARHVPETAALTGTAIVLAAYLIVGGRTYCAWVCPLNAIADAAAMVRRWSGLPMKPLKLPRETRLYVLGAALAASVLTGTIAWELVNPITALYRAALFGIAASFGPALIVFFFDLSAGPNAWCGHLCPVGAFYGLLNRGALLRVSAHARAACTDCMDCYAACPEAHVIPPALKTKRTDASPLILSPDCTACGRCIDVCSEDVFRMTHRFDRRVAPGPQE